jgi:hypothetical protein
MCLKGVGIHALSRGDFVQISCIAPPGYGKDHAVVVSAAGQSSLPMYFDYDGPVIGYVTPTVINAMEGTSIALYGHNFGPVIPDSLEIIKVMVGQAECAVQFYKEAEIFCVTAKRQATGVVNVTVSTGRAANASMTQLEPSQMQTSNPVRVHYTCPMRFYGRNGEVWEWYSPSGSAFLCCCTWLLMLCGLRCGRIACHVQMKASVLAEMWIQLHCPAITVLAGTSSWCVRHQSRVQVLSMTSSTKRNALWVTRARPAPNVLMYGAVSAVAFTDACGIICFLVLCCRRTTTAWASGASSVRTQLGCSSCCSV